MIYICASVCASVCVLCVCVFVLCVCLHFLYFLLLFAVLFLLLLRGFKTFVVVAVDFFSPCCCCCCCRIALMAYKKEEAKHSRVSTRGEGGSCWKCRRWQLGLVGSNVGSILAVSIGYALSAFLIPFIFLKKKCRLPPLLPPLCVCVCEVYTFAHYIQAAHRKVCTLFVHLFGLKRNVFFFLGSLKCFPSS